MNKTMLTFVSAGGLSLNPMLIFKAQRSKQNGEKRLHQDICCNHQQLDTSMQNCSTNMESISSSY